MILMGVQRPIGRKDAEGNGYSFVMEIELKRNDEQARVKK